MSGKILDYRFEILAEDLESSSLLLTSSFDRKLVEKYLEGAMK